MDNDYTQIPWPEVRKGDVLLHENGDRLTVRGVRERITVAGLSLDATTWHTLGFTPYRRKPEMPTQPGPHLDKDGDVWVQEDNGTDNTWRHDGLLYSAEDAARHAPFTRLVPMPTEVQVRKALFEADVKARLSVSDATDAVMALLTGKEADSE